MQSPEAGASHLAGTELWLVDILASAGALEAFETGTPRLSSFDSERIAAFADDETRRERRAAHIALRLLIERAFGPAWRGVPYTVSETGKPSLNVEEGGFSLSHAPGLALIAISRRGSVGVDIERERPIRISADRRQLIERASVLLAGGAPLGAKDPDHRLLAAWVRFEAVAKAEGCGVGPLLARFGLGRREVAEGLEEINHVAVDLSVPAGVFAAAALSPEEIPAPLRRLPSTVPGLEALLCEA